MGTARGAERASARRRGPLGSERGESSGGGPDANLGAAVQDGRVGESRGTVELAVTLVAGSDPVRGSVRLGGGHRREFWGWLELAEIVQEVAEGGRGAKDDQGELDPSEGAPTRL